MRIVPADLREKREVGILHVRPGKQVEINSFTPGAAGASTKQASSGEPTHNQTEPKPSDTAIIDAVHQVPHLRRRDFSLPFSRISPWDGGWVCRGLPEVGGGVVV